MAKQVFDPKAALEATKARLKRKEVDIKGVGIFFVQEMTGAAKDAYDESIIDIDQATGKAKVVRENLRAKLVVRCLVDENGNAVYQGKNAVAEAAGLPSKILQSLYDAAAEINGLGLDSEEDAAKN